MKLIISRLVFFLLSIYFLLSCWPKLDIMLRSNICEKQVLIKTRIVFKKDKATQHVV